MTRIDVYTLDLGDGGPPVVSYDSRTARPYDKDGNPPPMRKKRIRAAPLLQAIDAVPVATFAARVRAARVKGEEGAEQVRNKAENLCPGFSYRVLAFIRQYASNQAHGVSFLSEDLVDLIKANGIVPHDDRAFGSIFAKAIRDGLLITVDVVARSKGKGALGGRVYVRGPLS